MDLRRLKHFVAVAETENISHAAKRVHLSQPALSRQIQNLELDLGVSLFEREGRNLRLTSAGQDLRDRARKLLSEADAFVEHAYLLKSGDVGLLRVGATPQVLERAVPGALARFRVEMPGVEVRLKEGHPEGINEALLAGELDLALTQFRPELSESARPAGAFHLVVLSQRALGRVRKSIDLRELEGAPIVALTRGFGSRDLFDATCEIAHVRANIIFESASPATLIALAQARHGMALLPTTVELPQKGIVVQRLHHNGRALSRSLAVHWSPGRRIAPYGLRFAEHLAREARMRFGT